MLRISYELDSAYRYRQRTRMFGNIDTDLRPLDNSEIMTHEFEKVMSTVENLFERDDLFYREIMKGK